MQRCAFHAWHELYQASVADIEDESIDDLVAQIAVSHLAALEAEGGLHLVAIAEEAYSLVLLRLIVVFVHCDGELHFFDDDDLLLLACGPIALVLLVKELAVVLDLADGGHGIGRDLNQIEGAFTRHFKGVKRRHDPELLPILVNHANFACADAFVGADERLGGTFIYWWNKSPPQRPIGLAMRVVWVGRNSEKSCAGTKSISLARGWPTLEELAEQEEDLLYPESAVTYRRDGSDPILLDCWSRLRDVFGCRHSRHERENSNEASHPAGGR